MPPPSSASAAPSASAAASAGPAPLGPEPLPREVKRLAFSGGQAAFYPPDRPRDDAPVTVYLHGMCASGELECPVFASAAREGHLLCPDGAGRCDGGGFLWSSGQASQEGRLDAVVGALAALPGTSPAASAAITRGPRTLIGYSLGAPAALLQVTRSPGRYERLMLVNASTEPTPAQMKRAGIVRVALVAGQRDATAGKLAAAAKRLAAGGIDARFFALAATGHYFDAQSSTRMAEPMAWLLAR